MGLLVVLGAGASYDSDASRPISPFVSGSPNRPPTAAQLFQQHPPASHYAKALNHFPRCAPVIASLREAGSTGATIEQRLGELQDQSVSYKPLRAQLAATRFYIRDVIRDIENEWFAECNRITNQLRLVDALHRHAAASREQVVIVTFNYDRMLERAYEDALGITFAHMRDYLDAAGIPLHKPHGSIDWRHKVVGSDPMAFEGWEPDGVDRQVLELSDKLRVTGDVEVRPEGSPVWSRDAPTVAWIPALAIPTVHKSAFEAPAFHMNALKNDLSGVTRVLVIGWRGAEVPFTDLMASSIPMGADLVVVNGDQLASEETARRLAGAVQSFQRFRVESYGFSEFVSPNAEHGGATPARTFLLGGSEYLAITPDFRRPLSDFQ